MQNLPGQRLGAKQWFQHLRAHLESTMGLNFQWNSHVWHVQKNAILIHVDDILFVRLRSFWKDVFLRRKITEVPDGLILTPGTSVEKVVKSFEQSFGMARQQKVPCSSDLQLVDNSPKLDEKDASAFKRDWCVPLHWRGKA